MKERIPEERKETVRQEIINLLKNSKHTVGSLSKQVHRSEKEIIDHLSHIAIHKNVIIDPAECIKCGYVFHDRIKIKKPSKCPKCKGTYIEEPIYSISPS